MHYRNLKKSSLPVWTALCGKGLMKSVCWSLLRLFVAGVSISAAAIQLFPQDNSKPLTPNVFSYGHDDIRVSSPLQQKKNLSALICLGGPPNYCSNSTQDPVQETPVRPPLVDTPF